MPDEVSHASASSKRRRRRQRRKKASDKEQIEDENKTISVEDTAKSDHPTTEQKDAQTGKKKKKKKKRRPDRYFGRFHCKICNRNWDSAYVFTRTGTKQVLYKQRCRNCDEKDAWVFPYDLDLLMCSICQSQTCNCLCHECIKLKHRRYRMSDIKDKDGKTHTERVVDESFEYCKCEKRGRGGIGANINDKKPHLKDLCEKCLAGYMCTGQNAKNGEDGDNEP